MIALNGECDQHLTTASCCGPLQGACTPTTPTASRCPWRGWPWMRPPLLQRRRQLQPGSVPATMGMGRTREAVHPGSGWAWRHQRQRIPAPPA